MFELPLMKFLPQKPVLADAINFLDHILPKVLALLNCIHTFIYLFQVLPAGLFSNLFTTNVWFGG